MERFQNKVALVTGAGSGIGRATALRLAQEGASVYCVDLNAEAAENAAAEIVAGGGTSQSHACDIADPEQVQACVAGCVTQFDGLDCLVHMAGLLCFDRTHEMPLEKWQQVIAVNLTGTFLICQAALPALLERRGNIVNAASTAALSGLPWGRLTRRAKVGYWRSLAP